MSSDEERRKLLKPAVPLSAIVDFVSKNFSSTLGLPGNVVEVTKEVCCAHYGVGARENWHGWTRNVSEQTLNVMSPSSVERSFVVYILMHH